MVWLSSSLLPILDADVVFTDSIDIFGPMGNSVVMNAKRDEKTGQIVSTVDMPQFPGLDKILETAERMYGFVNQGTTKDKK